MSKFYIQTDNSKSAILDVNNEKWVFDQVEVKTKNVLRVAFNDAAQTTEVTMKPGASYIALSCFMNVEVSDPQVIPVKGKVEDIKQKLGL